MKEDIKIIEEMLRLNKNRIEPQIKNAIENLINKYKELEKERDGIYADYQDLGKEKLKLEEQIEEYKLNVKEAMHEAQENARIFRKEQAKANEYRKIVKIMSKTMHYICLFSSQSKYLIAKYCKIYNSENIGECEGLICSECVANYFKKKAKGE